MVLLLPPIQSLLSQLVTPQASPHTVLLLSLPSGSILVSHSTPTEKPWPELPWRDSLSEEDRNKRFAAYGRTLIQALGSFLLVLVASHVTPWTILQHKLKAAEGALRQPLEQVSTPISISRNGGGASE